MCWTWPGRGGSIKFMSKRSQKILNIILTFLLIITLILTAAAVLYYNKKKAGPTIASAAASSSAEHTAEPMSRPAAKAAPSAAPSSEADDAALYDGYLTADTKKWYVSDVSGNYTSDYWDVTQDGNIFTAELYGKDTDGNTAVIAGPGTCDTTADISQNAAGEDVLKFEAGTGNYYTFELAGTNSLTVYWPDGNIQTCALKGSD